MAGRHKAQLPQKEWKQPEQCKGCGWGRWDGVSQYCMLPLKVCWRSKGDKKHGTKKVLPQDRL